MRKIWGSDTYSVPRNKSSAKCVEQFKSVRAWEQKQDITGPLSSLYMSELDSLSFNRIPDDIGDQKRNNIHFSSKFRWKVKQFVLV